MNLHIVDTSNYIHAGARYERYVARGVRETNGAYEANKAPINGVVTLMSNLRDILAGDRDSVVMPVFDRPPTIKREMYANTFGDPYGYKAGRKRNPNLNIPKQREFAETLLRDAGFVVQAVDEYEADDIIYSLVKYYRDDFDHIYIHTTDSDLTFLVDEKVSIAPVARGGKVINIYNYATVAERDMTILYNTFMLRKLCAGDTSDNIPGIGKEWAGLMDAIIPSEREYSKLGDLDLCRKYLRQVMIDNPGVRNCERVLSTFNILCPLLVPEDLLNDAEQDIDYERLAYCRTFKAELDIWGLEDLLRDYIDSYYD